MPESEPIAAAPERKKSKRWLFVLLGVLPLIAVATWAIRSRQAKAAKPEKPMRVESVLHLETFVLNLPDPSSRCYLRIGIDVGVSRMPEGKGESSAPAVPMVRDTILTALSTANADELMTTEGKLKLKEALVRALQQRVPELGVQEVYFTELLIQR